MNFAEIDAQYFLRIVVSGSNGEALNDRPDALGHFGGCQPWKVAESLECEGGEDDVVAYAAAVSDVGIDAGDDGLQARGFTGGEGSE